MVRLIRRAWLSVLWLVWPVLAAPPLTTIQDVLYKADGTRFNGTLTISWNSFQSSDNSAIVSQSTTVRVQEGLLRVQLVPTTTSTPASSYMVTYNSDGRIQFQETWSVPSSSQPLHVRDVRVAAAAGRARPDRARPPAIPAAGVERGRADRRPGGAAVKSPGYAPGRTAVVDLNGMVASAAGNATDCVHVDGSSGPCGSGACGRNIAMSRASVIMVASTSSTAIGASFTMCCAAAIASWKLPKWQAPTARLPSTGRQLDLDGGGERERALRADENMREVDVVAPRHQCIEIVAADPAAAPSGIAPPPRQPHERRARTDSRASGFSAELSAMSDKSRSATGPKCDLAAVRQQRIDGSTLSRVCRSAASGRRRNCWPSCRRWWHGSRSKHRPGTTGRAASIAGSDRPARCRARTLARRPSMSSSSDPVEVLGASRIPEFTVCPACDVPPPRAVTGTPSSWQTAIARSAIRTSRSR